MIKTSVYIKIVLSYQVSLKMSKCQQNNHPSLVVNHHQEPTPRVSDGSYKLLASCRRKIIETLRCGGKMPRHQKSGKSVDSLVAKNQKMEQVKTFYVSECRSDTVKGSKKLLESSLELKEVVKKLQSGGEGALQGAKEVRELAKDDYEARTSFALLGAISPLVAMLDSKDPDSQIAALYALLNLGIGNDRNKAAIVEAGVVHKMLDLTESPIEGSPDKDLLAAIVANFLGLSALDSNKNIIGSSGAISFLIKSLIKTNNSLMIQDSLRALYNLSILPPNVSPMVEIDGFVPFILKKIGDMEVSDRILSILSNIVSTPEGRKAISTVKDAFTILVDVLNWVDLPDCQEKATYILMVMAHKSYVDRQAMIEAGIMSSLLELTLLGSTLAQKRSSRILDILKNNKGKQCVGGANVSAPLCGSTDIEPLDSSSRFANNNAVKQLVEQSLQSNMRRIVKRANIPNEFVPLEHSKSSVASFFTSKSLPL